MAFFLFVALAYITEHVNGSMEFVPGDLVQIVFDDLGRQPNATEKVEELIHLFDYSFGFVTERVFNKKQKKFECVVEHFQDRTKRLKIKEKYLRLMPFIKLHVGDAVAKDVHLRKCYWEEVAAEKDQCTFNVAQEEFRLWMEKRDDEIKKNMVVPDIHNAYPTYAPMKQFIDDEASRSLDTLIHILTSMPIMTVRRVVKSVKQNSQEHTDVITQLDEILMLLDTDMSPRAVIIGMEQALRSLGPKSMLILFDKMRIKFQSIYRVWSNVMNAKHGTDDLDELFCLEVVKNYQENQMVAVRGTFNVILWMCDQIEMDPKKIKKSIIEKLLEYYGSSALMERIVQIVDGELSPMDDGKLSPMVDGELSPMHQGTKNKIRYWLGFLIPLVFLKMGTLADGMSRLRGDPIAQCHFKSTVSIGAVAWFCFFAVMWAYHAFMLLHAMWRDYKAGNHEVVAVNAAVVPGIFAIRWVYLILREFFFPVLMCEM